jgi:hypothetical protein
MHDDELDRFKSDIHLVQYAVERHGYRRDRRESSRSSHVLRHPTTHDKIVVSRSRDGHWTYFSVRDDTDNGTIVDFVQERTHHRSLGHVRQELRHWLGTAWRELEPWPTPPPAPAPDRLAIAETFAAARGAEKCAYLHGRGIRRETLADPRFAGTWGQDARGNALFVHRDDAGEVSGFEIKGRGFTGFSPGGTKTAWQSAACPGDHTLVVTESAIDALSYHQLHTEDAVGSRYLSTAGAPSPGQLALLDRVFAKLPVGAAVVAAVDADDAGAKLAHRIEDLACRHARLAFRRHSPTTGEKDWNDVLQRLERGR